MLWKRPDSPIDLKRENVEIDSVNLALPNRLTATIFSCKLIQYACIDVGKMSCKPELLHLPCFVNYSVFINQYANAVICYKIVINGHFSHAGICAWGGEVFNGFATFEY